MRDLFLPCRSKGDDSNHSHQATGAKVNVESRPGFHNPISEECCIRQCGQGYPEPPRLNGADWLQLESIWGPCMNFRKASSEIDWANQPAPGSKDTMTTRHQDPIPDGTAACRWHNACLHVHQSIPQSQVTLMNHASPSPNRHPLSSQESPTPTPSQPGNPGERATLAMKPQDVWNWPHKPRVLASDKAS